MSIFTVHGGAGGGSGEGDTIGKVGGWLGESGGGEGGGCGPLSWLAATGVQRASNRRTRLRVIVFALIIDLA